jgi:hypothetical protein
MTMGHCSKLDLLHCLPFRRIIGIWVLTCSNCSLFNCMKLIGNLFWDIWKYKSEASWCLHKIFSLVNFIRMISFVVRNFCDLQLYHYTVNPCFVRDWEELPWFRTVCFIRSFRGHCFLKSHGCLPQWRCATITYVILLCVSACFIS